MWVPFLEKTKNRRACHVRKVRGFGAVLSGSVRAASVAE